MGAFIGGAHHQSIAGIAGWNRVADVQFVNFWQADFRAKFRDGLVQIFVQLLESLMLRLQVSNACRGFSAVYVEFVGGRRTGCGCLCGSYRAKKKPRVCPNCHLEIPLALAECDCA